MLGKILEIKNNHLLVSKGEASNDIINLYVKIIDQDDIFIGEISAFNEQNIEINLLGELKGKKFIYGLNKKPTLAAHVEMLPNTELDILFNAADYQAKTHLYFGKSALYEDRAIYLNINKLFANHFVVLGNTGSGKSCGTARLLQNLFYKSDACPTNATFFIIDAYGEYKQAFSQINYVHKDLGYKNYTTDISSHDELLPIPLWLLSLDDICLLLDVNNRSQIPIVEKALKFVTIFKKEEQTVIKYKNSIIAKALLDIFISGNTPAQIRDQIFSVLSRYHTQDLNLDSPIYQPGYTRPLKQCLMIDDTGKIRDMELVINFLSDYCLTEMDLALPDGSFNYSLNDLLYAFDFALIDEGILNDQHVFELAHALRVKLASICDSEASKFFHFPEHFSLNEFMERLTYKDGQKVQIVNLNLHNIDDRFAKAVAKIYAKLLFDYNKKHVAKGQNPLHIVLEEAHRYVQNDRDSEILGYNIFERIAKEGRKYAVLLGLISQRPSELSATVLSQCQNFIVFKLTHPADIEYIKPMIPYVDEEMMEKIKNLPTGNCLAFGSAFVLPTITQIDLATPSPTSASCNIAEKWF